jgi:hypothetical protein
MQVNSAQDWLTKYKRRVIASSIRVAPPPQSQRTNELIKSIEANGATQRERFVAPFQGAWGGRIGGATFSSECCVVANPFPVTLSRGVVPYTGRSVQPISVRIVP